MLKCLQSADSSEARVRMTRRWFTDLGGSNSMRSSSSSDASSLMTLWREDFKADAIDACHASRTCGTSNALTTTAHVRQPRSALLPASFSDFPSERLLACIACAHVRGSQFMCRPRQRQGGAAERASFGMISWRSSEWAHLSIAWLLLLCYWEGRWRNGAPIHIIDITD